MDHGKLRGPVRKSENIEERIKIHIGRRSEEAKIGLADEAMAILSSGQYKKIETREEKGSVKIWELDSDNSDFYSDSSVESDTDESSDSSRFIGHLLRRPFFVCFLR